MYKGTYSQTWPDRPHIEAQWLMCFFCVSSVHVCAHRAASLYQIRFDPQPEQSSIFPCIICNILLPYIVHKYVVAQYPDTKYVFKYIHSNLWLYGACCGQVYTSYSNRASEGRNQLVRKREKDEWTTENTTLYMLLVSMHDSLPVRKSVCRIGGRLHHLILEINQRSDGSGYIFSHYVLSVLSCHCWCILSASFLCFLIPLQRIASLFVLMRRMCVWENSNMMCNDFATCELSHSNRKWCGEFVQSSILV